jgi:hypothetical protein
MEDKVEIMFEYEPHCVHCGQLEPFTVVFDDGYVTWCIDCHESESGEVKNRNDLIKKECELKIEYFEDRIKILKEQLQEIIVEQLKEISQGGNMMNTYSMQIGVFGNTREQYINKMKEIYETLDGEKIDLKLTTWDFGSHIRMNDGTIYLGLLAHESARGHSWKQVYMPHDIDKELFRNVIYPALYYSDLPEDEQIIYY